MALTFVCQACFTRMQPVDASGVPVTKCPKCWSANLKPEGMPGDDTAPDAAPPPHLTNPVIPPELLEIGERLITNLEAKNAERLEYDKQMDQLESARREAITGAHVSALVAATSLLNALADLAKAAAGFLKANVKVG